MVVVVVLTGAGSLQCAPCTPPHGKSDKVVPEVLDGSFLFSFSAPFFSFLVSKGVMGVGGGGGFFYTGKVVSMDEDKVEISSTG